MADPAAPLAELADRAGVTGSTLTRRLERMRARGLIGPVQSVVDWKALGYEVEVSLRVTLDKTQPRAFDEFIASAAPRCPKCSRSRPSSGRLTCAF